MSPAIAIPPPPTIILPSIETDLDAMLAAIVGEDERDNTEIYDAIVAGVLSIKGEDDRDLTQVYDDISEIESIVPLTQVEFVASTDDVKTVSSAPEADYVFDTGKYLPTIALPDGVSVLGFFLDLEIASANSDYGAANINSMLEMDIRVAIDAGSYVQALVIPAGAIRSRTDTFSTGNVRPGVHQSGFSFSGGSMLTGLNSGGINGQAIAVKVVNIQSQYANMILAGMTAKLRVILGQTPVV